MFRTREELLRSLVDAMGTVWRSMHSGSGFRFGRATVGLPHVRILIYLDGRPEGVAAKDLAERLGVTAGAITQVIDALVEKGLVARQEDPGDRRSLRIGLTEYARNNMDDFKRDYISSISRVFDPLTDEDLLNVITILEKANIPVKTRVPAK